MSNIKACIFDFNATLIHSPVWMDLEIRSLPRQAFGLLAEQGHIEPLDDSRLAQAQIVFNAMRQTANISLVETSHLDDLAAMIKALDLQAQVSVQLIEQTVAALHKRCVTAVELIDGAGEMLKALRGMDYRLSIVSNAAYSPFLTWTLEHFGLLDYFEDIVVSADVRIRKPDVEIFRLALERIKLAPTETVYVGDDFIKDVHSANAFGMRTIWYPPNHTSITPEQEKVPDALITHLSQIPLLAQSWRQD
jgi:HAD superfamily hydrolase (TIGR01509 family)